MDCSPPVGVNYRPRRTAHHLPRQKDPVYDPIEAKRKQQEDLVKIYKPRRVPAIRIKTEETSKKLRTKEPQVQRPSPRPSLSAPAAAAAPATSRPPPPQRQPPDRAPLLPALLKKRSAPALRHRQGASTSQDAVLPNPREQISKKWSKSVLPALQPEVERASMKQNASANASDVQEDTTEILNTLQNMRTKFARYQSIERNAKDLLLNLNKGNANETTTARRAERNIQIQNSANNGTKMLTTNYLSGSQTKQAAENVKQKITFLPDVSTNFKHYLKSENNAARSPSENVALPKAPLPPGSSRILEGPLLLPRTLSSEGVGETGKMSARQKATVLPPLQREKPLDQKNVLAWKAGRRTKAEALTETLPACLGSKHLRPQLLK